MSDADLFGADRQPWSELSGADKLERLSFGKRAIRDGVVTLRKRIFARIPPLELHTHTITSVWLQTEKEKNKVCTFLRKLLTGSLVLQVNAGVDTVLDARVIAKIHEYVAGGSFTVAEVRRRLTAWVRETFLWETCLSSPRVIKYLRT